MKKVSLLAVALTAAATCASAQAPAPTSAPCPCPKAFQGFHLGGNAGYSVGSAKINGQQGAGANAVRIASKYVGIRGFDGGLNVGYTHRFGNFGLGLEGVFSWSSSKGQFSVSQGAVATAANTLSAQAKLKNSMQLRANFSYVIANLVAPKVILGWDSSKWELNANVRGTTVNKSKRFNGFLWGAGVDFLVAKHVIAGVEYTGTFAKSKVLARSGADKVTFKPQNNKFAAVIKFIY